MRVETAGEAELGALAAALIAAGLPIDDVAEPGRRFWRFEDNRGTVGFGGIEGVGNDRLIRSIVVLPARRGAGSGRTIVGLLERFAHDDGCRRLHLLTTDAAAFFASIGYRVGDRASAPATIAAMAQFARLCPGSATYLFKDIA